MNKTKYFFAASLLLFVGVGSLSAQQVRLDAGTKLLVPSSAHTSALYFIFGSDQS